MSDIESPVHARIGPRVVVYDNRHLQVYKVEVKRGASSKEIFVTDYGDRVGVLVEGPEGVLLTRQYRHLIDRISWEVPGGKVDPGESMEAAARRECLEETGVSCRGLKSLLMFHPGLDTLHNPTHLFYTQDFDRNAEMQARHDDEVCGRDWVPLNRCIAMISSGEIVDSLSIIALLTYNAFAKQE